VKSTHAMKLMVDLAIPLRVRHRYCVCSFLFTHPLFVYYILRLQFVHQTSDSQRGVSGGVMYPRVPPVHLLSNRHLVHLRFAD
jgi:hypothetical protein